MNTQITAFLPCRKGSERVINKNTKPFAGQEGGLLGVKLRQLLAATGIDEIVVSSNDPLVLAYAEQLKNPRVRTHHRDDTLGSSTTSTDALVAHALALIPQGHILWTHVTSPFFNAQHYSQAINSYWAGLRSEHDSLMSVTQLHSFIWDQQGPINYDRQHEKWPRTQTLPALYEINSALFLHSADGYKTLNDRIGTSPKLFITDKITGFDIDWPEDFMMAEAMSQTGIGCC
jgi:CMP-N-acetylneuraminic acid synthetase